MNLKKEILNLKGGTFEMSHPSTVDIDAVKKEKGIDQVMLADLPRETVGNILINCLANYPVNDKKEVFSVQATAAWITDESEDKPLLPEKLKNFLVKQVLPEMTYRKAEDDNGKQQPNKGIYVSWIMAQVYNELGVDTAE